MRKQNIVQQDTFVKLRGLPYSVTKEEIEKFFDGKLLLHTFNQSNQSRNYLFFLYIFKKSYIFS